MIDPRLAWFAIGATFGLVLCGWPWHPRFSRFSRRGGSNPPPPGRKPPPSACPPVLSTARWFINNPAMYAECGGPCEAGPEYCDCGQVRLVEGSIIPRGTRSISYPDPGPDRQPTNPFTGDPVKPQPHGGRVIRDGQWDPGWNYIDMRTGYQPRPHSGTSNSPPTDP